MKLRQLLTLLLLCFAASAMAKDNVITVKTARQFIEAIGPDRTIVIDTKAPFNITEALDMLVEEGRINRGHTYYSMTDEDDPITTPPSPTALDHVTYAPNFDGNTLQIRDVSGLTIRAKKEKALLLATPRYANVLEFIECENIKLDHIILGHTEEGYCDKGVIEFDGSIGITIDDCEFFGCGTEGFVFQLCAGVTVNRSTIYDCSYHTMHIFNSNFLRFNDCRFYNNREFEQIGVIGSSEVVFTHCQFDNLQGELFYMDDYVQFYGCVFHDCEIKPVTSEFTTQDYAILRNCSTAFGGVAPSVPKEKPQFRLGRYTDGFKTYVARQLDDYSILFEEEESLDGFALHCVDALTNSYETANALGIENCVGRMGARLVDKEGQHFVIILDDGSEPIKSLAYLGK